MQAMNLGVSVTGYINFNKAKKDKEQAFGVKIHYHHVIFLIRKK